MAVILSSDSDKEPWATSKIQDQVLIEMNEGPMVHHRSKRYEINFHELEARLYLARMALYDNTKLVKFRVNAINFTPRLQHELKDAQKHGMLGHIVKNSVFRLLRAYDELAFIEHVKFRPLKWEIISLD
jgi:hypothetical protein